MRPTPNAVDRLLMAIAAGDVRARDDIWATDVALDAVVPGWRLTRVGVDAVRMEYTSWFADPAVLEEVRRTVAGSREVVEYTLTWTELGVPHAARHVHVLDLDTESDRIVSDHVWCGGRWPAALLAEMSAAS